MNKKNITLYQILSIAVALFLWIYVALSQNPTIEKIYTIPVEFTELNEKLVLLENDYQVQVRVQGIENAFDDLQTVNLRAVADLADLQSGTHELPLQITMPENIQLVSCNPERISVDIEEKKTKAFPISVETGIPELPEGYNAMAAVASPTIVYITGAQKYLAQVDKVFVGMNISGLSETYSQSLPVQVMDTQGNIITPNFTITPSAIDVIVPIVADLPEKSVAVAVNYNGSPANDYVLTRIVVEPSTVNIYGELDELKSVLSVETETIDIDQATADIIQTVKLTAPEGIAFGNTDSVTVIMQVMPLETMTFDAIPIIANNVPADCEVEIAGAASVTLKGLASSLAKFDSKNILATVDLSSLKPGSYNLPVSVSFKRYPQPSDLTFVNANSLEARVTLTLIEEEPVQETVVSVEVEEKTEQKNASKEKK